MDQINQVMILILGPLAVWLSQSKNLVERKWASVVGLVSQPFWLAAAIDAGQWGVIGVSLFYTFSWARGLKLWFIKENTT